jgi:hypothetical protein
MPIPPVPKFREIMSITIKRLPIELKAAEGTGGKYGHWWIEIGDPLDSDSESYGWWPATPVSLTQTLVGVRGELNASSRASTPFRDADGLATRDPHHGDHADEHFHPLVAQSDQRSDDEIASCVRRHARAYNGKWQWFFEAGQNCHTFQLLLMKECKLLEPPGHRSRQLPMKYS